MKCIKQHMLPSEEYRQELCSLVFRMVRPAPWILAKIIYAKGFNFLSVNRTILELNEI